MISLTFPTKKNTWQNWGSTAIRVFTFGLARSANTSLIGGRFPGSAVNVIVPVRQCSTPHRTVGKRGGSIKKSYSKLTL